MSDNLKRYYLLPTSWGCSVTTTCQVAAKSIGHKLSLFVVCQGQNQPKSDQFGTSLALLTGSEARTEHQMPLAEMLNSGHKPAPRPTLCRNMARRPVEAHRTSFGVEFDIPTELLTCSQWAKSCRRCQPRQMAVMPGSPSDLRPKKPPSWAIQRTAWRTVGKVLGNALVLCMRR